MAVELLGIGIQFIGGLGMFLYGMNSMADGLQKSAGSRMQQLFGGLTTNRLFGGFAGPPPASPRAPPVGRETPGPAGRMPPYICRK